MGKVINTWDDDQLNLIQKIQHTFQCITSTKCNRWKSSMFTLKNLLRTTNLKNFSSIGQILLKISFSTAKITRFEKTSFKLMATEIVKIKLYYLNIRIAWKTKPRFFCQNFRLSPTLKTGSLDNAIRESTELAFMMGYEPLYHTLQIW